MVVKTLSLVCGCYEWGREVGEPDKGSKRANRRPIDVSVFLRQSRTRIPILLQFTVEKSQTTSICLLTSIQNQNSYSAETYNSHCIDTFIWPFCDISDVCDIFDFMNGYLFNIRATLKLFHIEHGWRDKYYLLITKIISDNNESKSGAHPP